MKLIKKQLEAKTKKKEENFQKEDLMSNQIFFFQEIAFYINSEKKNLLVTKSEKLFFFFFFLFERWATVLIMYSFLFSLYWFCAFWSKHKTIKVVSDSGFHYWRKGVKKWHKIT